MARARSGRSLGHCVIIRPTVMKHVVHSTYVLKVISPCSVAPILPHAQAFPSQLQFVQFSDPSPPNVLKYNTRGSEATPHFDNFLVTKSLC